VTAGKPPPAHCRSCLGEIYWAFPEFGQQGGKMPINAGSAGTGSAEVWRDDGGVLRYRMLRDGEHPGPGRFRGMPHWATCENADDHRRRR
jgi:hypothetical protein